MRSVGSWSSFLVEIPTDDGAGQSSKAVATPDRAASALHRAHPPQATANRDQGIAFNTVARLRPVPFETLYAKKTRAAAQKQQNRASSERPSAAHRKAPQTGRRSGAARHGTQPARSTPKRRAETTRPHDQKKPQPARRDRWSRVFPFSHAALRSGRRAPCKGKGGSGSPRKTKVSHTARNLMPRCFYSGPPAPVLCEVRPAAAAFERLRRCTPVVTGNTRTKDLGPSTPLALSLSGRNGKTVKRVRGVRTA